MAVKYIIESGRQVGPATIRAVGAPPAGRFTFAGIGREDTHYEIEGTRLITIGGFPAPTIDTATYGIPTYKYLIPIEDVEIVM